MIWHPGLEKRMEQFSPEQQLFMIANELNRAHHCQSDPVEYNNALERALELLDYHLRSIRDYSALRERVRLRDIIATYYLQPPQNTRLLQKILIQLSPTAWRQIGKSYNDV